MNPQMAEAHQRLGEVFSELKQLPLAVQEFRAALLRNPKLPEAHFMLGKAYAESGKNKEAVAEFQAALEIDPQMNEAAGALKRLGKTGDRAEGSKP